MLLRRTLFSLTIILSVLTSAFGNVIYVNKSASSVTQDGTSWGTAFTSIQAGINAAGPTDEVWVATGRYVENVNMAARVGLYGGFSGMETDLSQRDWVHNVTIIDGNQKNRCVTIQTFGVTVDGFTITNGLGGIFSSADGVTISNCTVSSNDAGQDYGGGGGIRASGDSLRVSHCVLRFNKAGYRGGGISFSSGVATLDNVKVIGNSANFHGAGVSVSGGTVQMNDCEIKGNATASGYSGGGVACSTAQLTLSKCSIRENDATNGGGLYSEGGTLVVRNVLISGNAANSGGGIYSFGETGLVISDCTIVSNRGDGIFRQGDASFIGNTISANSGIGIRSTWSNSSVIVNNIITFNGAGVFQSGGALAIRNNCVFGNTKYDYSGLSDQTGINGNIKKDPKLVSIYRLVRLAADSPCINSGDDSFIAPDSTDMENQPRVSGTHVDIGAYESDGTTHVVPQRKFHVSPTGMNTSDGLTWASAKRTVGAALDAAEGGDEVWVAAGTYTECVGLRAGIGLYGGFEGNEANRAARNWKANTTVLDGGKNGSVITAGFYGSTLDGFTIRNGKALNGGGVSSPGSDMLLVTNNRILANSAGLSGGGLYHSGGTASFIGNEIAANDASDFSSGSGGTGGGLYIGASSVLLANNTIANNSTSQRVGSGFGGGVYLSGDTGSKAILANNIVAYNTSGIYVYSTQLNPTLKFNDVYGNTSYQYSIYTDPTGTNGNIKTDPRFVNEFGRDYRLMNASLCIDAGDNASALPGSTDLDGNPRIIGPKVDIGAHEYGSSSELAARIVFVSQPGGATQKMPFVNQPQIAVQDTMGNPVISATGQITISIRTGTNGATLYGTTVVPIVQGVATFSDLMLDKAGVYILTASGDNLPGVESNSFSVTAGTPSFGDFNKDGIFDLRDIVIALRVWGGLDSAPR